MSIRDEFRKMSQTSTDPMASINEVLMWKNGKLIDAGDVTQDAEIVQADPTPAIHIPQAITTPSKYEQFKKLWQEGLSQPERRRFIDSLISNFISKDLEGFKQLLRNHKLVESVVMPQENIVPPEPVVGSAENTMVPEEKPFRDRLEDMKNEIEAKKGTGSPEEEKAWDDITSAFDLIAHHLDDINEDESLPEDGMPERRPAI